MFLKICSTLLTNFNVSSEFQPGSTETNTLVVSDIDTFLPKPTDLLVNLAEARGSLEGLLGRINEMFQENSIIGSATGPPLQAGFKLMVCTFRPFVYSHA